jgi:cysteinyl-tRNA synthetase
MSKSLGNLFTLRDISAKGFEPLDFRYLALTAHYRSPLSFTWASLEGARNARLKLAKRALDIPDEDKKSFDKFKREFSSAIYDDINVPKALGLVWKSKGKKSILFADKILGLGLGKAEVIEATEEIKKLLDEREILRRDGRWAEADKIRKEILKKGFVIEDMDKGPKLKRR